MTTNAHLAKAREYIGKGEQFYRQAAEEIMAARGEGWPWPAIGEALGREKSWAERLVAWSTDRSARAAVSPFGGESENRRKATAHARTVLRESSPEQIKQVLADLPRGQVQALSHVAYDMVQEADWKESDAAEAARSGLTPTGVRKQREASRQTGRRTLGVLDALIGLDKARGGLEAAVEALTEATPTDEEWGKFDWRLGQLEQAIEVIRATRARTGDWDAALAELQSS
jgi:hypothetical protein